LILLNFCYGWDANFWLTRCWSRKHVTAHGVMVVEGEQYVAGKVLKKGDFQYAPPNTLRRPLVYAMGGVVFAVCRFPPSDAA
jgi:hypothetical protein